jgi:glycosyltransferase involved in cell wall biosynthesis
MRADKGFWFLLEALPESMARALSVTIAAPIHDGSVVERLRGMAHRFHVITLHDGYTHATLDRVLAGVELGIVPPLWEDNLPQVAIEMVARGIPILTADRGGAREIAGRPDFTFAAGSTEDFRRKLGAILSGQVPLARFWNGPIGILTMEEHLRALMAQYALAADVPATSSEPETSAAWSRSPEGRAA